MEKKKKAAKKKPGKAPARSARPRVRKKEAAPVPRVRTRKAGAAAAPDGTAVPPAALEAVRVLRELRTSLRESAEQYISRVDGQLAAAAERLAELQAERGSKAGDRLLKIELKSLRKVKPSKGRLKDLAKIEGLAEKLRELMK